jgi:predicted nucleic acid-binding protein
VVHEFYLTATRKLKRPLSTSTAARMVQQLCRAEFIAADVGLIKLAIAHTHRYQINYWDGAILAAAEAFGASILYSEDLNHGQQCGSVQILNPFLP